NGKQLPVAVDFDLLDDVDVVQGIMVDEAVAKAREIGVSENVAILDGTKHKLTNAPGYQSRDLCCDELRTRVALTLSWHEGGMEYSSGDNRRRVVQARDFVGSG